MALADLLSGIVLVRQSCLISGLSSDSRHVQQGDLFIAYVGGKRDGRCFIQEALQRGAVAVLAEEGAKCKLDHVPYIAHKNVHELISLLAFRFYQHARMSITSITGTNGKTSVAYWLAHALHRDAPCGLLGTLGYGLVGNIKLGTHTTPDPIILHQCLGKLYQQGVRDAVMEASSHALAQGRLEHVFAETAIFTNLTREHLDYHENNGSLWRG